MIIIYKIFLFIFTKHFKNSYLYFFDSHIYYHLFDSYSIYTFILLL